MPDPITPGLCVAVCVCVVAFVSLAVVACCSRGGEREKESCHGRLVLSRENPYKSLGFIVKLPPELNPERGATPPPPPPQG